MSTRVVDGVRWIPVRSAAKMLGVSRQRVAKLCRIGALQSVLIDSTRLVGVRSVEARMEALDREGLGHGARG